MWEWDHKAMMNAISLHDRVMRMHLSKFGGYEVATEGDAFVIAFHTPGKAVAWATATQQVGDSSQVHACNRHKQQQWVSSLESSQHDLEH